MGHFGSGALFALFGNLCDALDGMVAREQGVASDAGEVLDAAVDRYTEFYFLTGLIVYYRSNVYLLGLALLSLVGSFLVSDSTAKAEALGVAPPKGIMRRHERSAYLIAGAALSPLSALLLELPPRFPFHPMVGVPMALALLIVGVASNASAAHRFASIARSVRAREVPAPPLVTVLLSAKPRSAELPHAELERAKS
ncbi:MAG: hypothetical protein NVS3B20_26110 [Polyangiales bacterium]